MFSRLELNSIHLNIQQLTNNWTTTKTNKNVARFILNSLGNICQVLTERNNKLMSVPSTLGPFILIPMNKSDLEPLIKFDSWLMITGLGSLIIMIFSLFQLTFFPLRTKAAVQLSQQFHQFPVNSFIDKYEKHQSFMTKLSTTSLVDDLLKHMQFKTTGN